MAGLNDIVFAIFLPPNQAASCTLDNVAVGTILCYQISNMILINAGAGVAVDSSHTTTLYCSFTFFIMSKFYAFVLCVLYVDVLYELFFFVDHVVRLLFM